MNHVKDVERSKIKNAEKWALMMMDPQAQQVTAPTNVPRPTCSSQIVKSLDIPYSETNGGYVTIALNPDPHATFLVSSKEEYPSAGPGNIALQDLKSGITMGATGYINEGTFKIGDAQRNVVGLTPVIPDGGIVSPFRNGQGLIPFRVALGETINFYMRTDEMSFYKILLVDAGGSTIQTVAPSTYFNNGTSFVTTGDCEYIMVQRCLAGGGANPPDIPYQIRKIAIACDLGQVPNSTNAQIISAVPSELLEQGRVSHVFMTSGQLLVTNLASPYDAGGEIVIGRVLKKALARYNTQELMEYLKSLSETKVWRSGPLVEGGFGWYLPDDPESYEPQPLAGGFERSDNVVVACVKMASLQGQIRANFTTRWDYYSDAQILKKKVGHTWTPASRALLEELAKKDAVSGNPTHLALLAAGRAALGAMTTFYAANKGWIDPLAIEVGTAVAKKVFKPSKPRQEKGKEESVKGGRKGR